jgi:hypothetical protein
MLNLPTPYFGLIPTRGGLPVSAYSKKLPSR